MSDSTEKDDEEFLNQDISQQEEVQKETESNTPASENLAPTEDNEVPAPADLLDMSDDEFEKITDSAPAAVSKETKESAQKSSTEEKIQTQKEEKEDAGDTAGKSDSVGIADLSVDDKIKVFDTLFTSFKANGREMKIETPEEALRLMQMGAGHLKYQAKVRPALAIEQTLKNNKIDQDKLNFLIDCANGKPEAIKKLVRDAKIEPYDIDTTEESREADANYRPTNHVVSDNDLQLSDTIATVQGTANGDAMLRTIRSEWDDNSKTKLVEDPEILNILVHQKNVGIYDRITSEVDRRRVLGKLAPNVSWLEAYYQVGSDMEKSGALSSGSESTNSPGSQTTPKPNESKIIETSTSKKKSSAGGDPSGVAPVSKTPVTPVKVDASVMDMSDDEFEKLSSKFG